MNGSCLSARVRSGKGGHMQGPSPIATKKTRLFRCTAALGLFLSLSMPMMWPSSAIAQQSSRFTAPVSFTSQTSSASDALSPLRSRTLRGEGTFPRKHAVELRMKQRGTIVAARVEEWATPRVGPGPQLAPVHHSPVSHALPEFVAEDTAFSTRVRMPITDLWGGRLHMDGFYLEVSANSIFRGLPQSSDLLWAAPASLRLRPATSYGVHLSFRLRRTRTRTLCRYLFGAGA